MDYRHYDQGRALLPPFIRRNLHYLRPVGILFFVLGIIIPFLTLLKLIANTYVINILALIMLLLAPIFYLVGLAFGGTVDRL